MLLLSCNKIIVSESVTPIREKKLLIDRITFINIVLRSLGMSQNTNKIESHDDTKKLSFVIVFLSLFVIALFGLALLA